MKHVAVYCRVSSQSQDTRSQEPDLKQYAKGVAGKVVWFKDSASGRSMNRPGWSKLESEIRRGRISAVVVWRVDRLGRTVSGLTTLFDELQARRVNLVSLRDGLDLSTPAGRLMANVLASVAQYETEVRGERVRSGQVAARKAGKRWGGSKPGVRKQLSDVQVRTIRTLKDRGESITDIAAAVKVSRPTVYAILRESA